MAIVDGYVSLLQVQAYIGDASAGREEQIEDTITAVSRAIEENCGTRGRPQRFLPLGTDEEPVARDFVASDTIATGDLVSISTITGDTGDGTFGVDLGAARLLPLSNDTLVPPRPFDSIELLTPPPDDVTHVRISGVWGWPAPPAQVVQACLIQTARLIERRKSPLGLAAGFGEFGAMRVFGDGWDQDAASLLRPFARLTLGFA
jgi:hypothetical protein